MYKIALACLLSIFIIAPCFASDKDLSQSWTFYKAVFINNDGRVIDYEKNDITTSEGQSYAMLRAIMINDKKTFDKVYNWTKNNLKRNDNNLFAWLWGENNNTYGILDNNSATDADIDIAFSLLVASKKWKYDYYETEAKKIIQDIWNFETVKICDKQILTAGLEQSKKANIEVNPSYFAPYAFRLFSLYDSNNWTQLIDDNYELLAEVINSTQTKLPPDWITINRTSGEIFIDKGSNKSDFSYDAVRTFIRIYCDYIASGDKRAKQMIGNADFFTKEYEKSGKLYTNIKENGEIRSSNEPLASIGILMPVINSLNSKIAKKIYAQRINSEYNKIGYWQRPFDYYEQNLVWIGKWIYLNENKHKKLNMGK